MTSGERSPRKPLLDDEPHAPAAPALSPAAFLDWGTARAALGLGLVGAVFASIGIALSLVVQFAVQDGARINRMQRETDVIIVLAMVGGMLTILGASMSVISLFMTTAPSGTGTAGWSIAVRVGIYIGLMTVAALEAGFFTDFESVRTFVRILLGEIAVVSVCWCLYLRSIAARVSRPGAAASAVVLLFLWLGLVGLYWLQTGTRHGMMDHKDFELTSNGLTLVVAVFQAVVCGLVRTGLSQFLIRHLRGMH